jgi:hypothetical protein
LNIFGITITTTRSFRSLEALARGLQRENIELRGKRDEYWKRYQEQVLENERLRRGVIPPRESSMARRESRLRSVVSTPGRETTLHRGEMSPDPWERLNVPLFSPASAAEPAPAFTSGGGGDYAGGGASSSWGSSSDSCSSSSDSSSSSSSDGGGSCGGGGD